MKKELKWEKEKGSVMALRLPGHSLWDDWMNMLRSMLKRAGIILMYGLHQKPKARRKKRNRNRFVLHSQFRRLTVREKIDLGYRVYHHMVNNPDFASASPSPAVLFAAIEDLREAHYDATHETGVAARMNLARKAEVFDTVFKAVLHYVESVANGKESVFRSAGIGRIS